MRSKEHEREHTLHEGTPLPEWSTLAEGLTVYPYSDGRVFISFPDQCQFGIPVGLLPSFPATTFFVSPSNA